MNSHGEDSLLDQFLALFKQRYEHLPNLSELAQSFKLIMSDLRFREALHHAEIETAGRNYINKHGPAHAFRVASNVLVLFSLIDKGAVQSDYMRDFPQSHPDKSCVLFGLVVSAYLHDCGRLYDHSIDHESQISDALEFLREMQPQICRGWSQVVKDAIPRTVKELCLLHDKKKEASGKVEIALLKLADALDCSKERVYNKPEWGDSDQKRVRDVFKKDKFPEEYFGSCAVESVKLQWLEDDRAVAVIVRVSDYGASLPVSRILQVLQGCKGRGSLEELARKIHIYLEDNSGQKILLHPESIVSFPGCEYVKVEYEVAQDDKGRGKVSWKAFLRNCGQDATKLLKVEFWGLEEVTWGAETKVQMYRSNHRHAREPLEISYRGRGQEPLSHCWAAVFPTPLQPNESAWIYGRYHWKKLINPEKDTFDYKVRRPTNQLRVTVRLPKGVKAEEVASVARVTDGDDRTILESPDMVKAKVARQRLLLRAQFGSLLPGYTYTLAWERRKRGKR